MIFSGYFINKYPKKTKRPYLNVSVPYYITVFFNGHRSEDLERNEDIEGEVRHKVNRAPVPLIL